MQWTIKGKLFGLTIGSLVLLAAVSAVGYWGITSVEQTTIDVGATGSAIRNHIEAGMYNDNTRADVSAIFSQKGDDQQSKAEEFAEHSKLLGERIRKARKLATDPASQAALDQEIQMTQQYVSQGKSLVDAILHQPDAAVSLLGPYLQSYKDLQGKIEITSDLLAKSASDAETGAAKKAAGVTRAMFVMCAVSLLLLLAMGLRISLDISRGLDSFSAQLTVMADSNDLTSRVDQERTDEIGELGRALNRFVENVHSLLVQIMGTAEQLAGASERCATTSEKISSNSEGTSAQANVVSQAAQQVNTNLQSVSTGAAEMTSTIQSIASNAHMAASIASKAVQTAQGANAIVAKLGASSAEIGEVIKVITSIAEQTNLLALNATIEAARAGEAGKGFAVVANEVKELAKQTAKATEDISRKITAIQTDTQGAVEAIGTIGGVISQINDISGTIATAVEEQSATTNEMTRNVADAAKGSAEITQNIEGVAEAARGTSSSAHESQKAASELADMASQLHNLVGQFKIDTAGTSSYLPAREPDKAMSARAGR